MHTTPEHDVVVAGAGPAGLAVGSQLAREGLTVYVFDKKSNVGQTRRSWLAPSFVVDDYAPALKQYMYPGIKRFLTQTVDPAGGPPIRKAWPAKLKGGYYFMHESELLAHWGARLAEAGGRLELDTVYFDHEVMVQPGGGGRHVVVETSRGRHTCSLLVDASGHDSMIRAKHQVPEDDYYWWSVYGCIAEHPDGFAEGMEVGDYLLWGTFKDINPDRDESLQHGRPVLEYELLHDNVSFPMILFLRKAKVPLDQMAAEFEHVLRREPSTAAFHDVVVKEPKYGWYPSAGRPPSLPADNVVFIGDAGCWTAPCGWGATFILMNYRRYARKLARTVRRGRLDADSLAGLVRMGEHAQWEVAVDQLAVHFLANAPARLVNEFITFWDQDARHGVDFLFCEKLFTLTLSPREAAHVVWRFLRKFDVGELAHVFPKEDRRLLLDVARETIEELGSELLHKVLHRNERRRTLRPGFDIVE